MRSTNAGIIAGLLTIGLVVSIGRAQEHPAFTLDWHATEECPSSEFVRTAIAQLLGPQSAAARPVSARATPWRGEDALWHVLIETQSPDGRGERKVDGPSCRAVADAAALIIALAVDPDAVAARAGLISPAPSDSASPLPPPSAAPALVPVVPPAMSSSSPLPGPPRPVVRPAAARADQAAPIRVGVTGGAVLDIGALPSPTPGWSAGLAVDHARWRFLLSGQFFAARTKDLSSHPDAGGEFDLWTSGLDVCRAVVGTEWTASWCAGAEAGKLSAKGYGVRETSESNPWWWAGTLGVAGEWRIADPLSLRLSAGIVIPFDRRRYVIEPYGGVHRAAPICGRFALGPVLLFP